MHAMCLRHWTRDALFSALFLIVLLLDCHLIGQVASGIRKVQRMAFVHIVVLKIIHNNSLCKHVSLTKA